MQSQPIESKDIRSAESVQNSQRSDSEIQRLWDELLTSIKQGDAKEITRLMTGVNQQEQIRLLKITDSIDSNLLNKAAQEKNKSFAILFDLFVEDVRNQALSLQNETKNTALHFAAECQPDDVFRFLVDKADAKAIDKILPLQNEVGSTVLHVAAFYKPGAPFHLIVEKANAEVISQTLSLQNETKSTALHFAAERQPDEEFCFLVKKVDAKAIDQILLLQNKQGSTALHLAAFYKPGAPFHLLVEKANPKEISQALSLQDVTKNTALHYAAELQPDDEFCFLVDKVDAKAIDQILLLQNKQGNTPLHITAVYKRGAPFRLLVKKANADAISQALLLQDETKSTALHFAAQKQPDDVFCLLVEKVDAKAIDQTLPLRNEFGSTALHIAAKYQRGDPFRLLIEKADAKVISLVLALQGKNKETVLHLAAWLQPGDVFRRLIEKADTKSIDQAVFLQNEAEETVLHVAACYQPSDAFAHLIKRCSSEALSKACCLYKKGQSVLESALSYQPPSVIAELLNKIDDNALKAMLKAPNIPSRLLAAMAGCLGHESSFQAQALVGRLFTLAGPQLADYCTKLWLAGKSLPLTVVQAALPHFERLIQTQPQRKSELETIEWIFSKEEKSERKEEVIRLKSGEVLELKDAEKAQETLWQQGLHSFYDYHLLKQNYPGSQLAQTADDLYYLGLLLKGCPLPFIPTEINPRLAQTNANGEVLFKTIKPKDWPEFVKQMGDYNYRADLRDPEQDKSEAKAKYVHKSGKIVKYEVHKDKKKDPYEQTIKQSVSLLSKNYDTAVFGEHDPNRQLVGLLFSKEFCVIKAMMLKDLGTFYRKWVGSEEDVAKYAEVMKDINVTDFEKFKEEIEKNPQRLNEMLVKLSRKAMLGVVMVTDTPNARWQARAYQKDILDELKIDLPIYFYDRALRIMRLYTPREREDDFNVDQHWELLRAAILADDAKEMASLMAGVGKPKKEKLLKYTNSTGGNLFHIAAEKSEISFSTLCVLFSGDVRDQALSMPDNDGCTAIHIAAQFQSSVDFHYLVGVVDATVINQVLPLQTKTGDTVLHLAALHQEDTPFRALIKKTDAKILNQALALQNINGETVLHIAASNPAGDAFCLLLEKADEETLVQVLSLEDAKEGRTPLLAAAIAARPSVAFVKLVERCSAPRSNALKVVCSRYNKKGESVLESVLPYQPPGVIAKLLNAIDDDALKKMLHAPHIPPRLFDAIASYVGHEPSFQTEPLISRLAKLMGPQLENYCIRLLLTGESLPPTVIQAFLPCLQEFIKEEKEESKEVVIIRLHSGDKLSLPKEIKDEEKISKIIWRKGLQSRYDYHLLKRHFPNSLMAKTADVLYRANLITRGCCLPFDPADIMQEQAHANLQTDMLVNFIKPDDWPEFRKQVEDNHQVPSRLISKNYNTAHDSYDRPVGLLFSTEGCLDSKEFKWCLDSKEFKQQVIEINPQQLNQVMATLSSNAMLGVICVSDTREARQQARKCRENIEKEFKIDLPIYFYDYALHSMRFYTLRERQDDAHAILSEKPGYNSIHEQDKELRAKFLEKLQEKLNKMPSSKQEFIELLEFYEMFEINKPPVPKKHWHQDIWQLGVSNSEVNQSATVKMIALLQGEYRGINEQEFNALKLGSLGEIMDAMKAKKLLPDEFERQKNIYAVTMRNR